MNTIYRTILILMISLPLFSCATPRGIVKLEGKQKAEVTDYNLFGFTLWTKTVLIEGGIISTVKFLKKVGHWCVVAGICVVIICGGIFLSVSAPRVQGIMISGMIVGGLSFVAGIVTSLLANPWILGGVLCLFLIAVLGGVYWLIKTRNWSLFGKAKELKNRIKHE